MSSVPWGMKARKILLFLTETLNSPACYKVSFDTGVEKFLGGHYAGLDTILAFKHEHILIRMQTVAILLVLGLII